VLLDVLELDELLILLVLLEELVLLDVLEELVLLEFDVVLVEGEGPPSSAKLKE